MIEIKENDSEKKIVMSDEFLKSIDEDVAKMALVAVDKLNDFIVTTNNTEQHNNKNIFVPNTAEKAKVKPTMHYISRPTVIPYNENKTRQQPNNGCGCFSFSMKTLFSRI